MPLLTTVVAGLLIFGPEAAPAADTVSVATLQAEYSSIIHLMDRPVGTDTFTTVALRPDASEAPYLGSFVEANSYVLVYLVTFGAGFDPQPILEADRSLESRSEAYFDALRDDAQFNRVLLPMIARYLDTRGITVAGIPVPEKRNTSFDRLVNFAVRFFYPDRIEQDGRIRGHICATINGLLDIQGGRDLELEALAYASIMRNVTATERPNLATEFTEHLDRISKRSLSTLPEMRVIRAQGAAWDAMAQSSQLEEVLYQGYDDWGEVLSFSFD